MFLTFRRFPLAVLLVAIVSVATPQDLTTRPGISVGSINNPGVFRITADKRFQTVADAFVSDWSISIDSKRGLPIKIEHDPKLAEEEYALNIGKMIDIRASTPVGAAWALSRLAPLLSEPKLARWIVRDKPAVPFRAVMLDVARRYHSPSTLRTMVRWCNAAKIRTIQLHLTDDQNWMMPTEVFKGIEKNNTHGRPTYTREELLDLQKFAEARGVSIIPEIDLPGHNTLLVKSDPKLFQIQGSESTNCINFGSPEVRAKLKILLSEVYKTFPKAPFVHLGGDEAWYPNAEKDSLMAESAKKLGRSIQEVFVDFISEMAEHVIASGRTPIVWEGFHAGEYVKTRIPKKMLVVAWEGPYYPAKQLVPDGFQVINAGWDPHYVVNHYPYDVNTLVPVERMLKSSYLNFKIVSYSDPQEAAFSFQKPSAVKGSLMCWWEGNEWSAHNILPIRILALGASLWSLKKRPTFEQLVKLWRNLEAKMEEPRLGFNVAVSGTVPNNNAQFTAKATLEFVSKKPNLKYAVRKDGQPPSLADAIVGNKFTLEDSANLSVQAYQGQKPVGEVLFLPIKKVTIQRSLTTGSTVTVDGERDSHFSARNLVDGISDDPTGYWLAFPCPRTVTINLGKLQTLSQIQVVTQWQNGAPTSYKVEGSSDRKTWETLADRSSNKQAATPEGYVDRFTSRQARYLRLTAIRGELFPNTISRILEIRAN